MKQKISLTGISRLFSNRNKNPLQEPKIASTNVHITGMANPRPLLVEGGPTNPEENANKPNL